MISWLISLLTYFLFFKHDHEFTSQCCLGQYLKAPMPVGTAMPVALDKMAACDTLGCLYRKKQGNTMLINYGMRVATNTLYH